MIKILGDEFNIMAYTVEYKHIYIGIDLHKYTHTAVIFLPDYKKIGEITFNNNPKSFDKLIEFVNIKNTYDLIPVFGLENAYGYGRNLAIYLIRKGYIVKDVNTSFINNNKNKEAMKSKNDSKDAEEVAKMIINYSDNLPDAKPLDIYFSLSQLVRRREDLKFNEVKLKNKLHEKLVISYPCYNRLFSEIDGKTALYFWYTYPSKKYLEGMSVEDLAKDLRKVSRNSCSTNKAQTILRLIESDGELKREYIETNDLLIRSILDEMKHKKEEIKKIVLEIKRILNRLGFKLETISGVDTVMAGRIISEIGDINRFRNADKLARLAGIAPYTMSSGNSELTKASRQGNRRLFSAIFFLAIQMVKLKKGTKEPINPIFYEYYRRKISEGKTKTQALICISRRLINIIYGMLKNKTEYRDKNIEEKKVV